MDPTDVIEDLNLEKLIDVVRSHPAIWNSSDSDYSDKIKKENSWTEVCKSFYHETWENLSNNDKKTAGKFKLSFHLLINTLFLFFITLIVQIKNIFY